MLVITLLVLALLGGYVAYRAFAPDARSLDAPAGSGYADQPTLGERSAPVKLLMFENFLCDHCKEFEEEVFPRIRERYIDTGQVEAYYVNLAWGEESARQAALAGECVFKQDPDAFWSYKTRLFEAQGQEDLASTDLLASLAQGIDGIDSESLRTCIANAETAAEVERDLALADRVGVTATPSVAVGQEGYVGPSFEVLANAIDRQLAAP